MSLIPLSLFVFLYGVDGLGNFSYSFPDRHIVGGSLAGPGQFPYQAGLYLTDSQQKSSKCGGSVIHKRWILTAAHCTDGIQRVTVFLGTTDLSQNQTGQQRYEVTNSNDIITHPNYQRSGLFNDIALIRLPRDIQFTDRIKIVRLAVNSAATYVNQEPLASGYGKVRDNMSTNQLWWTSLRVMSNQMCMNYYGNIITNEKLCTYTGPPPHSTCQGDSGGPLVLPSSKMLIGVTSFVGQSCEVNEPAGFQRVNVHKRWLERTTGQTFN